MAHHYTTKALGRPWAPPSDPRASPRISSRGRFGAWPTNSPRERHQTTNEAWYHDFRFLRGRPAERLGVLLALLICAAFLTYHHDRFNPQTAHRVWTQSLHRLRQGGGGSLLPPWSRVDWSTFAYVSYATSPDHLCNSLMLAESLHRLGARPDTLILYASDLAAVEEAVAVAVAGPEVASDKPSPSPPTQRLLFQATHLYNARVLPVDLSSLQGPAPTSPPSDPTWSQSSTKLLAFNQTQYTRVLSLDADATLRQPMDELFLLPESVRVAMPRAYWLTSDNDNQAKTPLSSSVLLATPDAREFARLRERVAQGREGEFDMEVVNALYGEGCMVLPQRPCLLLSGDLRRREGRARYLGEPDGDGVDWDAAKLVGEARYVHFSDWPVPKPWVAGVQAALEGEVVGCDGEGSGTGECRDKEIWVGLYAEFRERRRNICGPEFMQFEQAERHLKSLPQMAKTLEEKGT